MAMGYQPMVSKTCAAGKTLERFFNTRMGITPRQYAQMVEALCDSAVAVGHELIEAARNEPQWHNVAKHMLHAWDDGMASRRRLRKACNSKGSNRQSKPRDSPRQSLRNVRAK